MAAWLRRVEARDLRNIRAAALELAPGMNLLLGANAQGKTTLLEAVGLIARGRSFRTEQTASLIRRGAPALLARGVMVNGPGRECALELEVAAQARRLSIDGRPAAPAELLGRLDVVVYSTDRLRVVHGPMRERRLYLDRGAAALWPGYRQALREYERVLAQRNAALEAGAPDRWAWDERFVELGAALRLRRAEYAARLQRVVPGGSNGERYEIRVRDGGTPTAEQARMELDAEMTARRRDEIRLRRSLVGPHRDAVALLLDGEEAARTASSGQARNLLLALTQATIEVYRQERGFPPVALLDDLDSELDEERARRLCRELAAGGQALVTTAHPGWTADLAGLGRTFAVAQGQFTPVGAS